MPSAPADGNAAACGARRCLVTGGAGFLGRRLVEALLDAGYAVTVFDVRRFERQPPSAAPAPAPADTDAAKSRRCVSVVGDLTQRDQVLAACRGQDVVFHCATASPSAANASNSRLMHAVNVVGTENVIAACRAAGVRRLIYTSTASVVFAGRDLVNVDESSAAIPRRPMDYYTGTKATAERMVRDANDGERLITVALRPSGIFGEGDPLFVPTTVDKARRGKMKFIIGAGVNKLDWTYVGNVARAHLLAAEQLLRADGGESAGARRMAGRAYFITNDDPRPFWGVIGDVLAGLGYERPHIRLPFALVYAISLAVAATAALLHAACGATLSTDFTPSRILLATCERQMRCDAARRDFGYMPQVSMDEALARTVAWFRAHGYANEHEREHERDHERSEREDAADEAAPKAMRATAIDARRRGGR